MGKNKEYEIVFEIDYCYVYHRNFYINGVERELCKLTGSTEVKGEPDKMLSFCLYFERVIEEDEEIIFPTFMRVFRDGELVHTEDLQDEYPDGIEVDEDYGLELDDVFYEWSEKLSKMWWEKEDKKKEKLSKIKNVVGKKDKEEVNKKLKKDPVGVKK